jgi:dGTPase
MVQWEKLLSRERLRKSRSSPDQYDKRLSFDSDFDRVVFSSSFRRLQDKTQVFPLESSDFVRTRLTHSSEVAAVGRALGISAAKILAEREKYAGDYSREWSTIIATACMLHDIGNPPFGHSGEKYIGAWFKQKVAAFAAPANLEPGRPLVRARGGAPLELPDSQEQQDLLRFEGNAHAFRVATRIQTLGDEFGMNLTCGTLAALIKYPCSSVQTNKSSGKKSLAKFGYFKSDSYAFQRVRESTGLDGTIRHPLTFLVEAADDIAYSVVDIEDALKKKIISFELVCSYLKELPGDLKAEYLDRQLNARFDELSGRVISHSEREQLAFQHFRAHAIGKMTGSCVEAFCKHYDEIIAGKFDQELTHVMSLEPLCSKLKKLGEDHVYSFSDVVKVEESGKHVLWGLLDIFYDELTYSPDSRLIRTFLPPTWRNSGDDSMNVSDAYGRAQRVADYVAGMTDTFAISLFRRLTGQI